jgi:hypothetical protein
MMGTLLPAAVLFLATACPPAQAQEGDRPVVSVGVATEEGARVLKATVNLGGKPLEGVKVAFYAKRSFGRLGLGQEDTLEDGTAAVPFPEGLPGGPQGTLRISVEITAPAKYAGIQGEGTVEGGTVVPAVEDPFPRSLWSPRVPIALVVAIVVLLCSVWATYAYVLVQMLRIRKGGES